MDAPDSHEEPGQALLGPDEPSPVAIHRPDGASPVVLVCDHAGRRLPRRLGRLGLAEPDLDRHIAWDIGAARVARLLSDLLDAALVEQAYSRLVIDCNRPVAVENSIPAVSESTAIPGNVGLTPAERAARQTSIFRPYHEAIATLLDARREAGRVDVLVAIHSFTPVYKGEARPWHVGTLYGRDARLAAPLYRALRREAGLVVGDNLPYAVSDDTDWSLPVHGEARGLLHVGIEIRQDLLADEAGEAEWAERLARLLPTAVAEAQGGVVHG